MNRQVWVIDAKLIDVDGRKVPQITTKDTKSKESLYTRAEAAALLPLVQAHHHEARIVDA